MLDYSAPMPPTDSLSMAEVNARAVWVDWSEGWPEEWQAWEAAECEDCGHVRVIEPPCEGEPCDIELDSSHEGSVLVHTRRCDGEFYADGPMMSWAWPVTLRRSAEDAAESLTHLPVCIVEHTEHGTLLALTGGGMDLSWELCEAYIRLGLAPPIKLCSLPRMAGRGENDHDRRIAEACISSLDFVIQDASQLRARLATYFQ